MLIPPVNILTVGEREREIVDSVLTSLIVFMTLPSTLDGLANVFDHF